MVNSGSFDSDVDRNEKDGFTQSDRAAETPQSGISMHVVSGSLCENDFATQTADSLPVSQAIEPTATKTEYKCNMSEPFLRAGPVSAAKNARHGSDPEYGKGAGTPCSAEGGTRKPCVVNEDGEFKNRSGSENKDGETKAKHSVCCSVPLEKVQEVLRACGKKNAIRPISVKDMCLYCDRTFITSSLKQKHVDRSHSSTSNRRSSKRRQVSKQSVTTCMFCDKLNNVDCSLRQLFEHLTAEHPKKYFGCLECETRFSSYQLFQSHNVKVHGKEEGQTFCNLAGAKKHNEGVDELFEKLDKSENRREAASPELRSEKSKSGTKEGDAERALCVKIKNKYKSKYASETKEHKVKPSILNSTRELSSEKSQLVREEKVYVKGKSKTSWVKELRNKKVSVLGTKIGIKSCLRVTRQRTKILENVKNAKRKSSNNNKTDQNSSSTTKYLPYQNSCINPYPSFDLQFRVKKITDHSIDNIRISSMTFDDVFDKAFFNRVKCNIQENLLNYIDGKLFKSVESENRISSFQKFKDAESEEPNQNCGSKISSNAIAPVAALLTTSHLGEDLESQIEYGSKPSKKKTAPIVDDEVHYKYFTRRKYQAVISENREHRDLSKLDMWTQLAVKNRQQKILTDKKNDKELLEYTRSDEYKSKMQVEELNRILDKRGPLEDLKEEAIRTVALEKLNGSIVEPHIESYYDVTIILNELLNGLFSSNPNETTQEDKEIACNLTRSESRLDAALQNEEIPNILNLRRVTSSPNSTSNKESDKTVIVELTGEWARTRMYVCAACGRKMPNAKSLIDHKNLFHEHVWCQHYEFVGNQGELYRHLSIPALGKIGRLEEGADNKMWRRSDARTCSKCGKRCNCLGDLHRHILECGGDWSWMLARKKYKYRPYGSKTRKKKRGLLRFLHAFRERKGDQARESRKAIKKFSGPRQKPSDADTIQRMLANLPAKRITRKIISLKDGFQRTLKKQKISKTNKNNTLRKQKLQISKSINKAQKNKGSVKTSSKSRRLLRSNSSTTLFENKVNMMLSKRKQDKMESNSHTNRRHSIRNLNKVLSNKIMRNNANAKRRLVNNQEENEVSIKKANDNMMVNQLKNLKKTKAKYAKELLTNQDKKASNSTKKSDEIRGNTSLSLENSSRNDKNIKKRLLPTQGSVVNKVSQRGAVDTTCSLIKKVDKENIMLPLINDQENEDKNSSSQDESILTSEKIATRQKSSSFLSAEEEADTTPVKQQEPAVLNAQLKISTCKKKKNSKIVPGSKINSEIKPSKNVITVPSADSPSKNKVPCSTKNASTAIRVSCRKRSKIVTKASSVLQNGKSKRKTKPTHIKNRITKIVQVDGSSQNKPSTRSKSSKSELNDSSFRYSPAEDIILTNNVPHTVREISPLLDLSKITQENETPETVNANKEEQIEIKVLEKHPAPCEAETNTFTVCDVKLDVLTLSNPVIQARTTTKKGKKQRGLNDCIAMLTNKLQDKGFASVEPIPIFSAVKEISNTEPLEKRTEDRKKDVENCITLQVDEELPSPEDNKPEIVELQILDRTVIHEVSCNDEPIDLTCHGTAFICDDQQDVLEKFSTVPVEVSLDGQEDLSRDDSTEDLPKEEVSMPLFNANENSIEEKEVAEVSAQNCNADLVAEPAEAPVEFNLILQKSKLKRPKVKRKRKNLNIENLMDAKGKFQDIMDSVDENVSELGKNIMKENMCTLPVVQDVSDHDQDQEVACNTSDDFSNSGKENLIANKIKVPKHRKIKNNKAKLKKFNHKRQFKNEKVSSLVLIEFESVDSEDDLPLAQYMKKYSCNSITSDTFKITQLPEIDGLAPERDAVAESEILNVEVKENESVDINVSVIDKPRDLKQYKAKAKKIGDLEVLTQERKKPIKLSLNKIKVKRSYSKHKRRKTDVSTKIKSDELPALDIVQPDNLIDGTTDLEENQNTTAIRENDVVHTVDNVVSVIDSLHFQEEEPVENNSNFKQMDKEIECLVNNTSMQNDLVEKETYPFELNVNDKPPIPTCLEEDAAKSVEETNKNNIPKSKPTKVKAKTKAKVAKTKAMKAKRNVPLKDENTFCDICNKTFTRSENLLKHKRTLTHIAKLSELEALQAAKKSEDEVCVSEDNLDDINITNILHNGPVEFPQSTSLSTFTIASTQDSLKLVDIINDVLSKPVGDEYLKRNNFSNLILPEPEIKRCKSLGERKSFDCDKLHLLPSTNSSPTENLTFESSFVSTKLTSTADIIVEKQISLLENMIEDNFKSTNLPITEEYSSQSNSSEFSMLSSSKPEDRNEITFTHNTNIITNLIKPSLDEDNMIRSTQYEEISEDSSSSHFQCEEQKARKALNRDEELFLECCSLLKSSSDVSDLCKKSTKSMQFLDNFGLKPLDEIEWLEQKQLPERNPNFEPPPGIILDDSQMNSSVGDNFSNELSYSNSSSSNYNLSVRGFLNKNEDNNLFSQPPIFEDISTESENSLGQSPTDCFQNFKSISTAIGVHNMADVSLKVDKCWSPASPSVESAQIPEELGKLDDEIDKEKKKALLQFGSIKNKAVKGKSILDTHNSQDMRLAASKTTQSSIIDFTVSKKTKKCESKKMLTKGAMKVFEGLKVSIPKEGLDMKEVLSCSPTSKRLELEAEQESLNKKLSDEKDKYVKPSEMPSKVINNKSDIKKNVFKNFGNKLGLKIKKKNVPERKSSPKRKVDGLVDCEKKSHDIYDFEETLDSVDVFSKISNSVPIYHNFRNKLPDKHVLETDTMAHDKEYLADDLESCSFLVNANDEEKLETTMAPPSKKINTNKSITKKKCMIMGRIFKNAIKSKTSDEIKNIPSVDNSQVVENYVQNCQDVQSKPTDDDNTKQHKLSEEEMNILFDNLLNEQKPKSATEPEISSATNSATVIKIFDNKSRTKGNKCKKRPRGISPISSDEEFSIKKASKKQCNRKGSTNNECVINLEQELKECIGVASRKSQRKCTSGKQNVLVEYWSSDESSFETESQSEIPEPPERAEIPLLSPQGYQSDSASINIEEVKDDPPVLTCESISIPKERKKQTWKERNHEVSPSSLAINKKSEKISEDLDTDAFNSEIVNTETIAVRRQKRSAVDTLYYWSSSSEDELQDVIEVKPLREEYDDEDRPLQQGWIVGDSPKKLVTMLAQAKGKKVETECVKKNRKKRISV